MTGVSLDKTRAELFRHVTADKAAFYRIVMEAFAAANRQFKLQLRPDEVRAEAQWPQGETPSLEAVQQVLSQDDTALGRLLRIASESGEPLHLSLRRLLRSPPAWQLEDCDVFVCENPEIVAIAADRLGARCAPLICTDGMPAAAQRTLLTQLATVGAKLQYHGDFDWPGLSIGNFVMRSFRAKPWRFDAEDYLAALDAASNGAGGYRKLQGAVTEASWDGELAAQMIQRGQAVDEEAVAELLLQDLVRE